jgi:hypothetical protein
MMVLRLAVLVLVLSLPVQSYAFENRIDYVFPTKVAKATAYQNMVYYFKRKHALNNFHLKIQEQDAASGHILSKGQLICPETTGDKQPVDLTFDFQARDKEIILKFENLSVVKPDTSWSPHVPSNQKELNSLQSDCIVMWATEFLDRVQDPYKNVYDNY